MKSAIFELLPKLKDKEQIERDIDLAEVFFKSNKELQKAIKLENSVEKKYFIANADLKKFDCPIKKASGENYWEAFFIYLGFEYINASKRYGKYLKIR